MMMRAFDHAEPTSLCKLSFPRAHTALGSGTASYQHHRHASPLPLKPSCARWMESSESSEGRETWIEWHCNSRGHEFFCEIPEDYINDDFNLTNLRAQVPNYDYALDLILDAKCDETFTDEEEALIQSAAEMLYGLIHARYILTNRGLAQMVSKYSLMEFGRCPRVYCQGQAVLPVGQSDVPRMNTVKLYCPRCQDVFYPKYSRHNQIDGAYFGTTFPHLLLQLYPEYVPPSPTITYVPKIYGFKIHKPEKAKGATKSK